MGILYLIIAMLFACVVSFFMVTKDLMNIKQYSDDFDSHDYFFMFVLSFAAGVAWPFALIMSPVAFTMYYASREKKPETKEDEEEN